MLTPSANCLRNTLHETLWCMRLLWLAALQSDAACPYSHKTYYLSPFNLCCVFCCVRRAGAPSLFAVSTIPDSLFNLLRISLLIAQFPYLSFNLCSFISLDQLFLCLRLSFLLPCLALISPDTGVNGRLIYKRTVEQQLIRHRKFLSHWKRK
jgi:hypothetical protein